MEWRAELEEFQGIAVVRMPLFLSLELPSRGMVPGLATIGTVSVRVVLEPDGLGSHWFLWRGLGWSGETRVSLELQSEWTDPNLPSELRPHLGGKTEAIWNSLTPAARWDWVRWVMAAKQAETREKRAASVPSRLAAGKRRPCCFDRQQRTLTDA